MEVVVPLCVESISALLGRRDHPRIVEGAFGDHEDLSPQSSGLNVHGLGEFPEDVVGAEIVDPVDRVQSKPVDMVLGHPIERIVDDEVPDLVAVWSVVVHCIAPGRPVAIREVGTEVGQIISFGTKMVVDDIQNDGEPCGVAGIDECLQSLRTTIGGMGRVEIRPVIAPIASSRELPHRHQLNGCDTHFLLEVLQVRNDRVERSSRRKRSGMEFIDNQVFERESAPCLIRPAEHIGIDHSRSLMDAIRLGSGSRIWPDLFAVHYIMVAVARSNTLDRDLEVAELSRLHRNRITPRIAHMH